MGRISIPLPAALAAGLNGNDPTWFAFADLQGPADGGVDILMWNRNQMLVAASLTIDWTLGTGSMTPLWVWTPTAGVPATTGESNCLIFDVDGDGENEVVFHYDSTQGWDRTYCVETDPSPTAHPTIPGVVLPRTVAETPNGWGGTKRFSRARLSDTAQPMEIVVTGHGMRPAGTPVSGSGVEVWNLVPAGSGAPLPYVFSKTYEAHVTNTLGFSGEETHEFNAADIDGDGYDEFFINGVIDFVDSVGGVATPINGMYGAQSWTTGASGLAHNDQMVAADWNPSNPGLEVKAVPQNPYTDLNGVPRLGVDTLYDDGGGIIGEDVNAPASHGQSILGGNFTVTRDGFEALHVPKGAGVVDLTCHSFVTGCYMSDAGSNPLAVDGMNWFDNRVACPGPMPLPQDYAATGPSFDMYQVDWDGDYAQDEILDFGWNSLYVWRVGEKEDWLPGPLPIGMPTQAQAALPVTYPSGSDWIHFYQGVGGSQPSWNWNNGGVGRFTHYFQKLGESGMGTQHWRPVGFDLGRDTREEVAAIASGSLHVFYNLASNPTPNRHISPRYFPHYRQFRYEPAVVGGVFDYGALPAIEVDSLFASTGLDPDTLDANGPAGGANGLLDADEMGLLFRVLQDPVAWQRPQVEAAWRANVAQVFADLGTAYPDKERAILAAAYATLGDADSLAAAASLLGATLTTAAYDTSVASLAAVTGDMDADAIPNVTEASYAGYREQFFRFALAPSFTTILPTLGLDPLTLDANGVDRSGATPVFFQPNGMLDDAELALLSFLLYDGDNWLHEFVWGQWNANVTQVLADTAANPPGMGWVQVAAGYLSLGDLDSQDSGIQLLSLLGTTASASSYSALLKDILSTTGDGDLDSLDNLAEYTAVGGAIFPYFLEATTPDFDASLTSAGFVPTAVDFNGPILGGPNGLPDGPELLLLRQILSDFSAPGYSTTKIAFHANLGRLFGDAGGLSILTIDQVLYFGGILTLGDADSRNFALGALGLFGVGIDLANYDASAAPYVSLTGDPDADSRTNATEYANSSSPTDYVTRALDPLQ